MTTEDIPAGASTRSTPTSPAGCAPHNPRTVLLHIGTNDVLQNYNVSGAPQRLSALVDRITATVPNADVFVATIIPLSNSGQERRGPHVQRHHPGHGLEQGLRAASGSTWSTCTATLTTSDLIDGIHPTAGGYDKMAAAWYAALQTVPGSIGQPNVTPSPTPTPHPVRGGSDPRRRLEPVRGRDGRLPGQRRRGADLGLQRPDQPAVDRHVGR